MDLSNGSTSSSFFNTRVWGILLLLCFSYLCAMDNYPWQPEGLEGWCEIVPSAPLASPQLLPEEYRYVAERAGKTEAPLRQLLGEVCLRGDANLPRIAFCLSGGGYRAMISSLGFLLGAKNIGLFDTATYMAGLSGSTWLLGSLVAYASFVDKLSLQDFRQDLQQRVAIDFWKLSEADLRSITQQILKKKKEIKELKNWEEVIIAVGEIILDMLDPGNMIQSADLWGGILAKRLLGDISGSQELTFGTLRNFLQNYAVFPFPIFTATINDYTDPHAHSLYEWLEVTPFNTGSTFLNSFIKTEDFGSKFNVGQMTDRLPEETLGYFFGMFGSAYSFSIGDVLWYFTEGNHTLLEWITSFVVKHHLYKHHLLPSQVNNFAYGVSGNPLSTHLKITCADGGMSCNLPVAALLRFERAVDVIVVCDASYGDGFKRPEEIWRAADYAHDHEILFPSCKPTVKIADNILVFEREGAPTIIYFANPVPHPTAQMTYTKKEFDTLCDTMKSMVTDNKDMIVDAIKRKMGIEMRISRQREREPGGGCQIL